MPFSPELEQRIDENLSGFPVTKKKMFGGICYSTNGNICFGIHKDHLIIRVGPEAYPDYLKLQHVGEFNITGRAMTGWVMLAPEGYRDPEAFLDFLKAGYSFANTLPHK